MNPGENFITGFFAGFRDMTEGLGLITEPGLRRHAILPLLLSVIVFVVLLIVAIYYFGGLVGWVDGHLPAWLAWASWLLWIGLVAAWIFGFYFCFTVVVGIIGLPFFMALTNAVERRMTGRLPDTHRDMLYLTWIGFWRQFPRLGHLFVWLIVVCLISLVLFFIPLVNVLIAPLWFLFGAWAFAVMMSDFPLGARDLPWREQHALIRHARGRIFGFGIAASCMALVPVLNLFLLPATTAGITVLWVEVLEPDTLIERAHNLAA
ncbi:MAG: sulfate transporter CysZ [Gammaproteobacteria bacterium]